MHMAPRAAAWVEWAAWICNWRPSLPIIRQLRFEKGWASAHPFFSGVRLWLEMARAAHSRSDQAAELDAVNHAVQAHTGVGLRLTFF